MAVANPNLQFGRKRIYSDVESVTAENILEILSKALPTHKKNRSDIEYLYNYKKGDQPILQRTKDIRGDIVNKLVVNYASKLVRFAVANAFSKPVQYVSRGSGEREGIDVAKEVNKLNDYMYIEDKSTKDKELAEWAETSGTSYRMVLPSETQDKENPFHIYTLDPRDTFIIYQNGLGEHPLCGVKYVETEAKTIIYSIWTPTQYFELSQSDGDEIKLDISKIEAHTIGDIPIFEYLNNTVLQGVIEIVITLLDGINKIQSNRLDGIEQFIQSIMVLINCKMPDNAWEAMKKNHGGLIELTATDGTKQDIKMLAEQLDQGQTQILCNDLFHAILFISDVPSQGSENSSTSDTGTAVLLRGGWQSAEERAEDTELMFKKSENRFLKVVLQICNTYTGLDLKRSEIELKFTRKNYENTQVKVQSFVTLMSTGVVSILEAAKISGLTSDPEAFSIACLKYQAIQAEKEQQKSAEEENKLQKQQLLSQQSLEIERQGVKRENTTNNSD